MSGLQQFRLGLSTYPEALRFIFRHRMAWWFIVPVLINVAIFWGGLELQSGLSEKVRLWVEQRLNLDEATFWGAQFLNKVVGGFMSFLLTVFYVLFFLFVSGFVVLIVMSPVLSFVSEKAENKLSGADYPFSITQLLRDIWRGLVISLRNMFAEMFWAVLIFITGFIPVIGWFGPVVLFFVSAYFYGFSFLDYSTERMKLSVRQSVLLMRRYKWVAIGNGLVFSLALIPFCGLLLSPFVAIVSVVAATLAMEKIKAAEDALPD